MDSGREDEDGVGGDAGTQTKALLSLAELYIMGQVESTPTTATHTHINNRTHSHTAEPRRLAGHNQLHLPVT
jgi:hypothetical protein